MFGGLILLLVLSGAMALSSFFCGILPLTISLSNRQLRLISALGTGILVGTALTVIIPEGIQSIYEAHSARQIAPKPPHLLPRDLVTDHVASGVNLAGVEIAVSPHLELHEPRHVIVYQRDDGPEKGTPSVEDKPDKPSADKPQDHGDRKGHDQPGTDDTQHHHGGSSPESLIALSLILGFVLMYLVDAIPKSFSTRSKGMFHVSLPTFGRSLYTSPSFQASSHDGAAGQTLTLGLLVHSFADGIALGAAVTAAGQESVARSSLTVVLFLAIILHKGPAAFSLAALLLRQGATKRTIKNSVLLFSLAAPVGAVVTWALVKFLSFGQSAGESGAVSLWPGCVLLFSGGTFLYVASHALHSDHHHHGSAGAPSSFSLNSLPNPYDPYSREFNADESLSPLNGKPRQGQAPSRMEILLTVVGMLVPSLAVIGGGHSHAL